MAKSPMWKISDTTLKARRDTSKSQWRRTLITVVSHYTFASVTHLITVLSTVMMALNDIHAGENIKNLDRNVDYAITFLFTFEVALKIIAMGWRKSAVNGNASSHAQPNKVPNEDGDEQEDKEDPNSPSQDRETPQDCADAQEAAMPPERVTKPSKAVTEPSKAATEPSTNQRDTGGVDDQQQQQPQHTEPNPADLLMASEKKAIKNMFNLFDTDHNLTMDEFELVEILKSQHTVPPLHKWTRTLTFEHFLQRIAMRGLGFGVDRDHSGSIDYSEFESLMAEHMIQPTEVDGFMDSAWNRVDLYLILVRLAVLPFSLLPNGQGNFVNALARLLFLIRPLSMMENYLTGPSDILKVIPTALAPLLDLLSLFVLFLVIMSILCISLFGNGKLHGRCVVAPNNSMALRWVQLKAAHGDVFDRPSTVGELKIPEQLCTTDASCQHGFECSCLPLGVDLHDRSYLIGRPGCYKIPFGKVGESNKGEPTTLSYGYLGFNNFAQALFTVWQVCTLSRWPSVMEAVMQAYGMWACSIFILIIIGLRYWIINLAVAIIPSVYLNIRRQRVVIMWDEAMARAEIALLEQLLNAQFVGGEDEEEEALEDDLNGVEQQADSPAKRNIVRKSKAEGALVSALGDLIHCTPRELTAHIRSTFAMFDTDNSGEISAKELADAFRAMGMVVPEQDIAQMAADADMNEDGAIDIEEFEELVKKMISTVREREEPETTVVQVKEPTPLWLGLIEIPDRYFQRNLVPLHPISLSISRMLASPAVVDECGERVPGDVVLEAKRRNLMIQWGPSCREWRLMADRGGASIGMKTRKSKNTKKINLRKNAKGGKNEEDEEQKGFTEMFPSNSPIPGGEGVSENDDRSDMRHVILQFDVHQKWRAETPKHVPNNTVPYFDVLVLQCILANTFVMTLSHFDGSVNLDCQRSFHCPEDLQIMSSGWFLALQLGEVAFNVIFTLEAVCKIVALGSFMRYISQAINTFDFTLVVVSDILMILSLFNVNLPNVSFFRALRLLRAFLMITRFHRLRLLFRRSAASMMGTCSVVFLLMIFLSIFAIMGMNIFKCSMPKCATWASNSSTPSGECLDPFAQCTDSYECDLFKETRSDGSAGCPFRLRHNFNTFFNSISSMFVIFTAEKWSDFMLDGMRSQSIGFVGIYAAIIFFTLSYLFFNQVMANMFIAVIMDNFSTSEAVKMELQERSFRNAMHAALKARLGKKNISNQDEDQGEEYKEAHGESNDLLALIDEERKLKSEIEVDDVVIFGCLHPASTGETETKNLRGLVRDVLGNVYYQRLILLAIIISCVVLVLESPIEEYSLIDKTLASNLNTATFVLFLLEMILNMLDHGLFWEHPKAYFRVSWNVLDFIVVVAQALDMMNALEGANALKVVRVLRPLRLLNRVRMLQVLINVLHHSLLDCIIVAIIFFFLIVVCAIFAQTLFAGFTYSCSDANRGLRTTHMAVQCDPRADPFSCDPSGRRRAPAIQVRQDCRGYFFSEYAHMIERTAFPPTSSWYVSKGDRNDIMRPRVWEKNANHNFDSFSSTLHTFMQVWALDNWVEIALSAVDATDYGHQPSFNNRPLVLVFFWIFLIASRFFIPPLIITVMLEHMASEINGTAIYTDLQCNWLRFQAKLEELEPIVQPEVPTNPMQRKMWRFVEHPLFERFFCAVIILNTVLMTTESYDGSETWTQVSWWINAIFIVLYLCEMGCKLAATYLAFFSSIWNVFDLTVTLISLAEVFSAGGGGVQALRVLRLFRIFRTLRIIRRFPTLYVMVQAIGGSAGYIMATFTLLAIFVFVFAVIASFFFAGLKHGWCISRLNNLNDVATSFLLLFQVSTNSNMASLITDASVSYPSCTVCTNCYMSPGGELVDFSDCGSKSGAIAFFDLYMVGVSVIMLLFVAVLIDSYFAFMTEQKFVLQDKHLESFRDCWLRIDPSGSGRVSVWKLRQLLEDLHIDGNPLGSCGLSDPLTHRALRMQILIASRAEIGDPSLGRTAGEAHELEHTITFKQTCRVLALTVAGSKALPFDEMHKHREALNFYAQASVITGTVLKYTNAKFRRDVFVNRLRAQQADNDEEGSAVESHACVFYLADRQGVVIVDPDKQNISMCSLQGEVQGQVDLEGIVKIYNVAGREQSSIRSEHDTNLNNSIKSPFRRRQSESMAPVSHCVRVQLADGHELEIWLQDSIQCKQFIAVTEHYCEELMEAAVHSESPTPDPAHHEHQSATEILPVSPPKGTENDIQAHVPATPMFVRYLAAQALAEMQENIERLIDKGH